MKKILITLLTGILLIVSAGVLMASPLPQTQSQNFDLAITSISSRSDKIAVGDIVVFDVTYQNNTPITPTIAITFNLKLTASQKVSPERYQVCTKLITTTLDEITAVTSTVSFDGCNLRFADQGVQTIRAELQSADGKEFQDRDPTNNAKEIEVSVAPYQTALPDEIGRIFAGLGLLSAVMAIMAAGTEVIIDILRVGLGMKSKVTATDALEKLRRVLPGELAALGVDTSSREAVWKLTTDLQTKLKPTMNAAAAWNDLANNPDLVDQVKELTASYFDKVDNLIGTTPFDPSDTSAAKNLKTRKNEALEELKGFENAFVTRPVKFLDGLVGKINDVLKTKVKGWNEDLANGFETGVKGQIQAIKPPQIDQLKAAIEGFDPNDGFSQDDDKSTKKKLTKAKQDLKGELDKATQNLALAVQAYSPELAVSWLETQRDTFKTQSTTVVDQLDDLMDSLSGNGLLPKTTATEAKNKLSGMVQNAITAGNSTIDRLGYLLDSVEKRRNATQSPVRKVWRTLREMEHGFLVLAVGAGIFTGIAYGIAAGLEPATVEEKINTVRLLNIIELSFKPPTSAQITIISLVIGLVLVSSGALVSSKVGYELQRKQINLLGTIALFMASILVLWLSSIAIPFWAQFVQWVGGLVSRDLFYSALLVGIVAGVVLALALWLLARIGEAWYVLDHKNDPGPSIDKSKFHQLHWVEFLFNKLRGQKKEANEPNNYGQVKPVTDLTAANAAGKVLEFADIHDDQEGSRLRWMRAISVPIGIVLAYQLKIDAFTYLNIAVPGIERFNGAFRLPGFPPDLTAGMILTGFAASAGSAFWHDQLDRLQAVKQQAEAVATSLKQVQATVTGEKK